MSFADQVKRCREISEAKEKRAELNEELAKRRAEVKEDVRIFKAAPLAYRRPRPSLWIRFTDWLLRDLAPRKPKSEAEHKDDLNEIAKDVCRRL